MGILSCLSIYTNEQSSSRRAKEPTAKTITKSEDAAYAIYESLEYNRGKKNTVTTGFSNEYLKIGIR